MVLCQVKGCKYADFHVTSFHKCGKCKNYGHGQTECNNIDTLRQLGFYYLDKVPKDKKCKIGGCKFKDRHTTEGHVCHYCSSITDDPIIFGFHIQEEASKYNIKLNYYIEVYAGMGCV